jgi:hypothetical protein
MLIFMRKIFRTPVTYTVRNKVYDGTDRAFVTFAPDNISPQDEVIVTVDAKYTDGDAYVASVAKAVIINGIISVTGPQEAFYSAPVAPFPTDLEATIEPFCIAKEDFAYTGSEQTFTMSQEGYYLLEAWGAEGNYGMQDIGGKGGYSKGDVYLYKGDKLYVNVGNRNGASDMRINANSLFDRLIVAGAGGAIYAKGGHGGGSEGGNSTIGGTGHTTPQGISQWLPGKR